MTAGIVVNLCAHVELVLTRAEIEWLDSEMSRLNLALNEWFSGLIADAIAKRYAEATTLTRACLCPVDDDSALVRIDADRLAALQGWLP